MVCLFLILLVTAAAWYFYSSGFLLYYGDAQAHLNISRSIVDSRNPGYEQLGTVWLPVLHIICLPFVARNYLWTSGLAGTIPVSICFVIAGSGIYWSGKLTYKNSVAASVSLLCFALNPNILYLATITMTEVVFLAGLATCLFTVLLFRQTQNLKYAGLAIGASWWMSLTRYDGWFLIPFIVLALAYVAVNNRLWMLIVGTTLAALAPLYWMAHNWWLSGNALDFYNGPYSAAAIQGNRPYPGFHDWPRAIRYYFEAGRLCSDNVLIAIGILGLAVALWRGRWFSVSFLALTPLFYVWSLHGSKTPIHVPTLSPFSYYNTRYGIAVTAWMAFAAGALVMAIPQRHRRFGLLIPVIALLPWLRVPAHAGSIVWKESQVNSDARRAWTEKGAEYLKVHLSPGDGVLTQFGDLAGVFCKAGIPLKEGLHEGNGAAWFVNTMPHGLVRQAKWAMAQDGDKLSRLIAEAQSYSVVNTITVEGAPKLLIYKRRDPGDIH